MQPLDRTDIKILDLLQQDCTLSIVEIAERVGLSTTPCWRRLQRIEERGLIQGRVAILNGEELNVGETVFVAVRTNQHNAEWLLRFQKTVAAMPEVVDFFRMAGEIDYLIRVVLPNIRAYDDFYRRLIASVDLLDVSAMFAMEKIKATTHLPLNYVAIKDAAPSNPSRRR